MSSPRSVLIVDDEPPVLLTYEMILRQHGYDAVGVPSSREARECLAKRQFDLLMCDLALDTERGGLDLIDETHRANPRLPAVLLTGYASEEIMKEAERKGIAVLFKPIDIQELLSLIASLMTPRQRYANES